MSEDFLPILGIDHVELYVGNARQAAFYYERGFGFRNTAYAGLETGVRDRASYVLEQGNIRLVFTAGLDPDDPISRHQQQHGDGVSVIALQVPDVVAAYREATARGASGALRPTSKEGAQGVLHYAAIRAYGDTVIKFVDRSNYDGTFASGYEATETQQQRDGVGLQEIDHIVGNVTLGTMNHWVEFFARTMGFRQFVHFDDRDISTEYSALMSKVMEDGTGKIKLPINEPAEGKKKSQIQEFLDYYGGPGVQHLALSTPDILDTIGRMRREGIEFLRVPNTYYTTLEERVGLIEEPIEELADLGILVDRDEEGYLLQIFTKPVGDRPTLFYEIIQRHGSRGFGKGNFKALFEALEREQAVRGNL